MVGGVAGRSRKLRFWGRQRREGTPETFDVLGFKHIRGRKCTKEGFIVRRLTSRKRFQAKLKETRWTLVFARKTGKPKRHHLLNRRMVTGKGHEQNYSYPSSGFSTEERDGKLFVSLWAKSKEDIGGFRCTLVKRVVRHNVPFEFRDVELPR